MIFNEYEVTVRKSLYETPGERCKNLGHGRYQCGHCKKGYFHAANPLDQDEECPECKYQVFVKAVIK